MVLGIVSSADAALVASNVDVPKTGFSAKSVTCRPNNSQRGGYQYDRRDTLTHVGVPIKNHELDTRQEHASHDVPRRFAR